MGRTASVVAARSTRTLKIMLTHVYTLPSARRAQRSGGREPISKLIWVGQFPHILRPNDSVVIADGMVERVASSLVNLPENCQEVIIENPDLDNLYSEVPQRR